MTRAPIILGMMSGTSCDGIDAAIVRFGNRPELLHFTSLAMPRELREPALRLAAPGVDEIDCMGELDNRLGRAFAEAALAAIDEAGLKTTDITAIGNHGQTIRHRPRARPPFTLQIGCASTIAEHTGITTISNFRCRDMAAGGEGAPLVPFAHRELFVGPDNTAIVNIGGIANVTWLGADGSVIGFDTGPGNMLMDGIMLGLSDGRYSYDNGGELAAAGTPCTPLLDLLLSHPFLERQPPKSTGREEFGQRLVDQILGWPEISDADRLATANAFTVISIANSSRFFPAPAKRWLVCGGGAFNRHLMQQLTKRLAPIPASSTETEGIPPQAVESISFAILARQALMGRDNTLPSVTGARHAVCGGQITPGANWQELMQLIPQWTR